MKKTLLLFAGTASFFLLHAQSIPNYGFETWVNNNESPHTYLVPQSWITTDAVLSDFYNLFGDPTYVVNSVARVGSAHGGTYAAQMSVVQSNEGDTVAGAVFSTPSATGVISSALSGSPCLGFPYTVRSANFTGFYKFTSVGGDSAVCSIVLTKWNSTTHTRDTLTNITTGNNTNSPAWTQFTVPLTYAYNENPDTAFIVIGISAPTPHPGTVLTVDDLGFNGTVALGIPQFANNIDVTAYPNPFNDNTTIQVTGIQLTQASVEIYDMLGNRVQSISNVNSNDITVNREGMATGIYFYNVISEHRIVASGKLSVQ